VPLKDKTNAVLRRTTGYSLTRETPAERDRALAEAADRAARKARRETRQEERQRQREQAEARARQAEERRAQRKRERAAKEAARRASGHYLPDRIDDAKRRIITRVQEWTMTGPTKLDALIEAVRYIERYDVPGDVVECGVWRGGSMQAVALALLDAGDTSRELHLFDTFEGMPPPTDEDARTVGGDVTSAAELLATSDRDSKMWAAATLEDVQDGMARTSYPADKIHYHRGLVEETTPQEAPERIALLRLDTDWYASTKHELEHLYDRLVPGGVLILDDYHSWDGAKQAVDEWLEEAGHPLLFVPIGAGLIAAKPRD